MGDGRENRATHWRRFVCGVCIGLAAIAAVAVTVVLVLAYGRTARPPSFDVSDVSLTRFELSTSAGGGPTNISYSLTLNVTVRNPNWAMGATIRSLEADYLFDGQRFGRVRVPGANGSVVRAKDAAVFSVAASAAGEQVMNLTNGNGSVKAYRKQRMAGKFDILVGFCGQVTYKPHAAWCRLEVSCRPLKLSAHGAAAAANCTVVSPQPQGGC